MDLRLSGLVLTACLATIPLAAQATIGGGTCDSSIVKGTYAVSFSGRQVSAAGTFTSVMQANGSATFDGLSQVTMALTVDTGQAVGTPTTWSGSYSLQSNCARQITIKTGGSAIFNIAVFNGGANFLLSGSDSVYSYSGNGDTQATGCSASTFSGVYTFTATGFSLSSGSVNGGANLTGLLQFDGQSHLTANITSASTNPTPIVLTGSYSVSSNCLGSATLTDAQGNSYVSSISAFTGSATTTAAFYVSVGQSSKLIVSGNAHFISATGGTGTTCSASNLNGTYSLMLSGRGISSAGSFTGGYQAVGTASFDGQSKVTFTGTVNTNLATGKTFTYGGSYTVGSNCSGTITFSSGSSAVFALVVWNSGRQFNITGADTTYTYSGNGSNFQPAACGTATLSGQYSYNGTGFTLAGTAQNGASEETGVLQFDGQGNVTSNSMLTSGTSAASPVTATGTYTVAACLASATLVDSTGKQNSLNFAIAGNYGEVLDLIAANSQFIRAGAAHSTFTNPTQAIGNVASYALNATPAGSVFALFGSGLATRSAQALLVPLPTTLLTTQVLVNGQPVPLFYVDSGQIDAQMPWEIPGNTLATVVVKNGNATSNTAAIYVPATGTPGISVYNTNRAVVVNKDNVTVNTPSTPAAVGDEVVAYFTGGGPVQTSGKLVTGAAAPNSQAPVTGNYSITVGTVAATVIYIGLTPGSVGLYQANFIVPQLAKGTYAVQITISGFASNSPVMTVSN
jgi:uncharacterized protein (TIGR03437 family)